MLALAGVEYLVCGRGRANLEVLHLTGEERRLRHLLGKAQPPSLQQYLHSADQLALGHVVPVTLVPALAPAQGETATSAHLVMTVHSNAPRSTTIGVLSRVI